MPNVELGGCSASPVGPVLPGGAGARVAERRWGRSPRRCAGFGSRPGGGGVVGIRRSNGSRINDLQRRMSNSDAVPLRPPAPVPLRCASLWTRRWRRVRSPAGSPGPGRAPEAAAPRSNRNRINDLARRMSKSDAVSAQLAGLVLLRGGAIRGDGRRRGVRGTGPPGRWSAPAWRVFGERTGAESTTWSAGCRTRIRHCPSGPAVQDAYRDGGTRRNARPANPLLPVVLREARRVVGHSAGNGRPRRVSTPGLPPSPGLRRPSADSSGTLRDLAETTGIYQMSPRVKPSGKGSEGSRE